MKIENPVENWGNLLSGNMQKTDYPEPDKDPIYEQARQNLYDKAMNNPNDVAQNYDQAISHGRGFIKPDSDQGLWSQAISDKASQRFNSMAEKLKLRSRYDQAVDNNSILSSAVNAASAQRTLDRHIQMRKAEAEANYQAARAKAISSILGTAGMVVGAAFGGPVGAAAGGAVGNTAGGALTGGAANREIGMSDQKPLASEADSYGSSYPSEGWGA